MPSVDDDNQMFPFQYGGYAGYGPNHMMGGHDNDSAGMYNPRTHSKVAEKEGFHMGGTDEPRTL